MRNVASLVLLAVCVSLFRSGYVENSFGLSTSSVQFVLVPLVLLALGLLSFNGFSLPKKSILLAFFSSLTLWILAVRSSTHGPEQIKVYVSPFREDTTQSLTIKFTDLLNNSFARQSVSLKIESLPDPLNSPEKIDKFFEQELAREPAQQSIVISGSPRWLKVSLSPKFSYLPSMKSFEKLASNYSLAMVENVSSIGFSDALSQVSIDFLTRTISGIGALGRGDLLRAEKDLLDAAALFGRWTTPIHRSYVLWLLGNIYMSKVVDGDRIERGYLSCAIDYYSRARRMIRSQDSPELLSAILNNRAVAHFLAYVFFDKRPLRAQALRELSVASKFVYPSGASNKNPAWLVAKLNLYNLKKPKKVQQIFKKKLRKKNKAKKDGVAVVEGGATF